MNPEQKNNDASLERISAETGVAIAIRDAANKLAALSNNNSICSTLYSSEEFSPHCAQYCGKAHEWATAAGKPVDYLCHAGLSCRAVPLAGSGLQQVAIVGRTFVRADRYKKAVERAINGDWKQFPPTEFFDNVLISGSESNIEKAVRKLEGYKYESEEILELGEPAASSRRPTEEPDQSAEVKLPPVDAITKLVEKFDSEVPAASILSPANIRRLQSEAAEWRSLLNSLALLSYEGGCRAIMEFVAGRYAFDSLLWLERVEDWLEPRAAQGSLKDIPVKIGIKASDPRFVEAARREAPVTFRERRHFGAEGRRLNLFPVTVAGELRAALAVEGSDLDAEQWRLLSRFCRRVGPQIEILRLKNEVSERDWMAKAVRKFNESLRKIDTEDFWTHVTQLSAELLQAERASLLIRNEKSQDLQAKATVGARINLFNEKDVGSRVSRLVLEEGTPVVVPDIEQVAIKAAPAEWKYRTGSFMSYPITIGDRRIAVMNFTDKASGESFSGRDLELLQAIAPQIAVAIDRTALKDKAGEFEQLSVTDPLTALSNRRYIERRLDEEIERSKRHRFPMSLMMLDVDEFKSYNDRFGHPAGDIALKIVADVLKDTLRSADVAARYGGEEFAILLPQTTASEAAAIAERIRIRIERTEFPKRRVTISIGIAACSADINSPGDLIDAADHALYEAKNHGRNNVQVYDGLGKAFNEKIH